MKAWRISLVAVAWGAVCVLASGPAQAVGHEGHEGMANMPDCPMRASAHSGGLAASETNLSTRHVRGIPSGAPRHGLFGSLIKSCPRRSHGVDKTICEDCCCGVRSGSTPGAIGSGAGAEAALASGLGAVYPSFIMAIVPTRLSPAGVLSSPPDYPPPIL